MVRPALVALVGVLLLTCQGSAAQKGDLAALSLPASRAEAVQAFVEAHPASGFVHDSADRIETIYGKAFVHGATPQAAAEQFRLSHAGMWGIAPEDLVPVGPFEDGAHTVPIMFEKDKGTYKFTGVYYMQTRDGIEVFRSRMMVLARNEANYPIVLASADLRDIGDFRVAGGAAQAMNSQAAIKNAAELMPPNTVFNQPRLVIWAGVDDFVAPPVLALEFIGMGQSPEAGVKHELFVANAASGALIYNESLIHHVDIAGNVSGVATEGNGADLCANESPRGLPYARVEAGAVTVYTDVDGNYVLPNAGASPVNVTSHITGLYFDLTNCNGTELPSNPSGTPCSMPAASLTSSVNPPGPGDFLHNAANTDEYLRAQVNAYIHANIVRDYVLEFNPSYPTISNQLGMNLNVNLNSSCNAFYSSGEQSINFYRSGGTCTNTSNSTVVYHEFGHHVVATGGSGQGAYGEGMSDCIAVLVTDDPCLGAGFNPNSSTPPCSPNGASCTGCLRTAANTAQYQPPPSCSSCGSAIHSCGMLISGCVWSTRNELLATNPSTYRDIISGLTVNSVLLHIGNTIGQEITTHFLTLDDDDSDIGNGTPHYTEIAAGFGAHNMPAPPLNLLGITYPNGRPDFVSPAGATTMQVNVQPVTGTPQPGSGKLLVSTGGPFVEYPMVETSPNVYLATFPPSICGVAVEYYVTVTSTTNLVVTSPSNAPATTFSATSGLGVGPLVFEDNFELDQAWAVSNSAGLATGAWERGVPVPAQAAPSSDADGSGQCYVTGLPATLPGGGNNDIDGGSTTITSSLLNADVDAASVSYWRWYNNNTGAAPQADVMVVEISDDGGATWIVLETVGPTVNSPNPEVNGGWVKKTYNLVGIPGFELNNQFRIRFTASDLGTGSYVEAGVDGVKIESINCTTQLPGDANGDGVVNVNDLLLVITSWGPCPGCDADLNGDGLVNVADLLLVISNWSS